MHIRPRDAHPIFNFMAPPVYAGIFKHKFRGEYPNKSCVYKIWAGDKFYMWKCQALHNSMHHTGGDLERMIRSGPKPGHLFSKLVDHIVAADISELEVEMMLQSEDAAELLKYEHNLLKLEEYNPLCLNKSFVPHIPKWMPAPSIDQYNKWKQCL